MGPVHTVPNRCRPQHSVVKQALSFCLAATGVMLYGCANSPGVKPLRHNCRPVPSEVPAGARCYSGEDGNGSFYRIAIPGHGDQQVLVMHAHICPADTGPAQSARSEEDLKRWAL